MDSQKQMNDAAWLAWIEQLAVAPARDNRAATLPRSLFHCRLDDQPDHLAPQRLLPPEYWEGSSDRPLFLNPACYFTRDGELPQGAPPDGFAHQGDLVWIKDPGNDAVQPFWAGPELCTLLSGAQPGDPAPTLPPQARRTLIAANLLVDDDYVSRRRRQWDDIVSVVRPQFHSRGYGSVAGLIHPFHIAALRRYYRYQIRTGKLSHGDDQSPLRYKSYNDPVARFFQQQLTAAVTAFAGEPLKASYVYLASYQPGAMLEKHTDRAQCDFS